MAKLLLLLVIVVVVVLLARKIFKGASTNRADTVEGAPDATPTPEAKLVRCVECGAFVPRADALPAPSGFRCGGAGCGKG